MNKAGGGMSLADAEFPQQLSVTASLDEALAGVTAVVFAVPSQTMRQNVKLAAPYLRDSMVLLSAAKGLEIGTNKRMSQVVAEEKPGSGDFKWLACCNGSGCGE
jgi:glycerol-3-phosphate dehydrogenase